MYLGSGEDFAKIRVRNERTSVGAIHRDLEEAREKTGRVTALREARERHGGGRCTWRVILGALALVIALVWMLW